MIHLVTGYAGYEHIQSEDEGAYNASFFGGGQYVMEEGNQFEGSILDNNTVRILDGNLLMYGRHVRIARNTYEDVIIQTGTAGKNRIDLICMTYAKNDNDGTETSYLQVIKGAETEGTAVVPEYTDGNILEGAILNHMPLYKVVIEGVVLKEIVPMFKTIPTYKTLAEQYAAQFEATIKALKDADILDTMEEIEANTQGNMFAGALAVKEGFSAVDKELGDLNTNIPKVVSAMPSNYTGNYGSRENVLVYSVVYKDFVEIHIKGIFEGVTDLIFADMNIDNLIPNVALYGDKHALGTVDGYETGKLVVVGYLNGKSLQLNANAKDTYNITLCIGILE